MKKYNIIGDIHGRTCWKELVIDDGINIFVGDYFSPYHWEITWEQQKQNFLDIIDYKEAHPETILLIGNHDEDHWHWCEPGVTRSRCSRHDFEHEAEIKDLFEGFKDYFLAAYAIEDKALVTHAGLSALWYFNKRYRNSERYNGRFYDICWPEYAKFSNVEEAFGEYLCKKKRSEVFHDARNDNFERKDYDLIFWNNFWYYWKDGKWNLYEAKPQDVADFVNTHWKFYPEDFSFSKCALAGDYCGTSETHGPMWIRIQGLENNNLFSGTNIVQIFGHTIDNEMREYSDFDPNNCSETIDTGKMVMIDCLEYQAKSYTFEV